VTVTFTAPYKFSFTLHYIYGSFRKSRKLVGADSTGADLGGAIADGYRSKASVKPKHFVSTSITF